MCDGSPRVAHVIGLNLKHNPDDLLRQPDTVNVWNRYIAGDDDSRSAVVAERRVVLQYVALFKRFGFLNPVSAEAKAIAQLVERENAAITWPRFRAIVRDLQERKILQGDVTLYITPRLLHIKLWVDWWDRSPHRIIIVVGWLAPGALGLVSLSHTSRKANSGYPIERIVEMEVDPQLAKATWSSSSCCRRRSIVGRCCAQLDDPAPVAAGQAKVSW